MTETKFKFPEALGACADRLYEIRQQRLALQKDIDALAAEETALKEHLIATLPKSDASGIAGKLCRVAIVTKAVPQVEDWDVLYKHIKRTGQFDLMQRRLVDAAVKERWDVGKKVPGVGYYTVVSVSLNKL